MIRKEIRKWIAVGMIGAMVSFLAPWSLLCVKADNGRLDPYTGEPIGTMVTPTGIVTDQTRKMLSATMYYDYNYGSFVYPVGSNGATEVTANVADGMVVNQPVQINVPAELGVILYRNGNEAEFSGGLIKNTGEYTLRYSDGGNIKTILSFTIVGNATGLISGYTMPSGFRIRKVYKDQGEGNFTGTYVSLAEEGLYTIEYECEKTGISYSLVVRIDHTPPQVTLDGVKDDGKARGPVTINGLGPTDRIYITRDGEDYKYTSPKLTQSGRYQVLVADDAENTLQFDFTIMIYIDTSGFIFFAVVTAVVAALVTYIIMRRKNLRVR